MKSVRAASQVATGILPHIQAPPKFTLATLRSFPSLEPTSCIPVSTTILGQPLRRDILWRAVVFENDRRRVGASNPPGRSENGYSRRKLFAQKGTGRARVGDANSPIRHNGGRALARTAPNDYSTKLPNKIYNLAFATALSYQYRKGDLFIIGKGEEQSSSSSLSSSSSSQNDMSILDIPLHVRAENPEERKPNYSSVMFKKFLDEHGWEGKRLLFVVNEPREGLLKYTNNYKNKVDVIQREGLEVNDILKASKVLIEFDALKALSEELTKF